MSNIDPLSLERSGVVREVGGQAIWSLSSCKPGISNWLCIYRLCIIVNYLL